MGQKGSGVAFFIDIPVSNKFWSDSFNGREYGSRVSLLHLLRDRAAGKVQQMRTHAIEEFPFAGVIAHDRFKYFRQSHAVVAI